MKIYYPTMMNRGEMQGKIDRFNEQYFDDILPRYQIPRYRGTEGKIFAECNGPAFPPYAISVGDPEPVPLPAPYSYTLFNRPCNEHFEQRKRDGEIVVSNMTAHGLLLYVDSPGFNIVRSGAGPYRKFSLGLAESFKSIDQPPTWWGSFENGRGGAFHGPATAFFSAGEISYLPVSDYPLQTLARHIIEKHDSKVDGELVQQVHAEANSGTLDLLTEFAELPETLKWIYDLFKKSRSTIQDFKNKRFALNERTANRQKSLRKRISELHQLLTKGDLTERQKGHLSREMRKLNQDLTYSIYELGQKTTSLWLQFRYALSPIIYSIRDACKLTFKQKLFRKFRKRSMKTQEVEDYGDWSFEGEVTLTKRANIKRSFAGNHNIWGLLKREFAPNVLATLWEITRLSFVVDWFISIGDAITASFVSSGAYLQEGATYSAKLSVHGVFRHKRNHAAVRVEGNLYDRKIINPSDHTGLYFGVDMNWKRQLDALALFVWPGIRRTFK